jgi:hypothetical protein
VRALACPSSKQKTKKGVGGIETEENERNRARHLVNRKSGLPVVDRTCQAFPLNTVFLLRYLVTIRILVKEKTGFENLYTVKDEERATKVLIAHNPTFRDKLVDSALDIWTEAHVANEETRQG